MEKMNQVSVSEFFAKSKEEMYDDAVAMVEKYNRLVDICNDSAERMAELMAKDDINEFKKEKKEGYDYAREGFKLYVKNTLAEAEGNKNEANEVITEAVRSAYAEWSKAQKEEETEVKGNGRTSSGQYPWGAKVNDIPCGEDAIE